MLDYEPHWRMTLYVHACEDAAAVADAACAAGVETGRPRGWAELLTDHYHQLTGTLVDAHTGGCACEWLHAGVPRDHFRPLLVDLMDRLVALSPIHKVDFVLYRDGSLQGGLPTDVIWIGNLRRDRIHGIKPEVLYEIHNRPVAGRSVMVGEEESEEALFNQDMKLMRDSGVIPSIDPEES